MDSSQDPTSQPLDLLGNESLNESTLHRRQSDSNLGTLPAPRPDTPSTLQMRARRRQSQIPNPLPTHQDFPAKSISALIAQRQQQRQLKRHEPSTPPPQNQEDTFNQTLEIRLHHSVGSMSISPTCRDVVLAGRLGLVIIDLEDPWLPPRMLPHMSKWEVADVQWSPYVSRESWVASTSNQKLIVWNLNYSGSQAIEHVLHAHSRAISDINWSPHHPDILATCSVDTYVHLWDLRCAGQGSDGKDDRSVRPANSFTPWNAATTQVKFNRKSEFLLASAHDKDVKIWDIRKGAVPVTSITAHSKKIYGIDWSRQNDHDIVTCSLDKLVKFWNINTPEREEEVISTNTPVWRARNTPFGNGVLMMPQRTESKLFLYNRASPEKPVHAFEGHVDTVKEFVWRWKGGNGSEGDEREFQLVTWSKDQNLRLWPVSKDIMKTVGHNPSPRKTMCSGPINEKQQDGSYSPHSFQQIPKENQDDQGYKAMPASVGPLRLTPNSHGTTMTPFRASAAIIGNSGYSGGYDTLSNAYREQKYAINPLLWMQNVKTVGPVGELRRGATTENTFQTVTGEMSTVLNKYASAGVKTEKINAASRTCTISLHGPWSDTPNAFLRITVRFPPQYPDNSPPEFEIQKNSMMSIYYRAHMAQDLNALASSYTSQKKWCLEPCIRYLLGENFQEDGDFNLATPDGIGGLPGHSNNGSVASLTSSPGQSGYITNWNGPSTVDNGDSDDEIFAGPSFMSGFSGYGGTGKRVSLQSEKLVDMSSKQSADETVPFPRLCGGVFSGNGQLVCFFSTLRVRDSKRTAQTQKPVEQDTSARSNTSNGEYFENTYSDFYKHPRTYEQFEEYKEIAAMSRQGRNATVLVAGSGGAFGEYAYDEDPDEMDDGLSSMASLYFKPDSFALSHSLGNRDSLLYRGPKTDRVTYNVVIADFTDMMPYSPWLAKEYILSADDPVSACIHNAEVCKAHDRHDLFKVWSLALEILRECVPLEVPGENDIVQDGSLVAVGRPEVQLNYTDQAIQRDEKLAELRSVLHANRQRQLKSNGITELTSKNMSISRPKQRVKWGKHPLGQKLADNLLQHFIHIGDIQTAAMLSCILKDGTKDSQKISRSSSQKMLDVQAMSDDAVLDYFSIKSHTSPNTRARGTLHRAHSGPHTLANSPSRASVNQMSASYGTRGVNLLTYFWLSDRNTSPQNTPEKITDGLLGENHGTTPPSPHRVQRTPQPWYPTLKLPSNTAPGIRHAVSMANASGSHPPNIFSPSPNLPYTDLPPPSPFLPGGMATKEGRIVPSTTMSIEFTNTEAFDGERFFRLTSTPLLNPRSAAQHDVLRLAYADMLYRWSLLDQRAELLKFMSGPIFPDVEKTMQINIRCYYCGSEVSSKDSGCNSCRKIRSQIRCSLCHVLVRGLVNFCIKCGHGGHSHHIKEWFEMNQTVCPTGCGCHCLIETFEYGSQTEM
ncbi:hypothetical protein CLU79DRAFT_791747 [Phycomyces nitens]|nr:hypothetical protein CLU79DRAFT_791747 [Phycomyces nitens]